jgi:hypothetical protein
MNRGMRRERERDEKERRETPFISIERAGRGNEKEIEGVWGSCE